MGKSRVPTDAEIRAARELGTREAKASIRAISAEYRRGIGAGALSRIWLTLANGNVVLIDVNAIPELAGAKDTDLERLEVMPGGTTIECEPLDVHLSVEALTYQAVLGEAWVDALRRKVASINGGASSEAKAAAVRENGRKGGRPRIRHQPYGVLPPAVEKDMIFRAREEVLRRDPKLLKNTKRLSAAFDSDGTMIFSIERTNGQTETIRLSPDLVQSWLPADIVNRANLEPNESATG